MQQNSDASRAVFWLLSGVLVFAPLFRAGNLPLPIMLLELASVVLLGLLLWDRKGFENLTVTHLLMISGMLALPLIQMIPLPVGLWVWLPGREVMEPVLQNLNFDEFQGFRAASLVTSETESSLWALLMPIAVFASAIGQPQRNLKRLMYVLLAMAVFQACLSLMQYGGKLFQIANEWNMSGNAGTFLNKDHLAGFLEMMLPVLLGLMAANIGTGQRMPRRLTTWRKRFSFLASGRGHKAVFFAALAILLVLALIFIRSRAGIALAMLGILIGMLVFSRRLGGSNLYGTYGTVLAIIVAFAIEVGLAPVLDRFSQDPMADARWRIYDSTLTGLADYFPLGSGSGTYPLVYPRYQPENMDVFVNHAHSDYLEWVFEGGMPALILILAGLTIYGLYWRKAWIRGNWLQFRYIQVGAGIGLLLMMLHSFVDFNLHKPANIIYFAFLLAVFMRENHEEQQLATRSRTTPRTLQLPQASKPEAATPGKPQTDPLLDNW